MAVLIIPVDLQTMRLLFAILAAAPRLPLRRGAGFPAPERKGGRFRLSGVEAVYYCQAARFLLYL